MLIRQTADFNQYNCLLIIGKIYLAIAKLLADVLLLKTFFYDGSSVLNVSFTWRQWIHTGLFNIYM